jgi:hypothetical protein
MALNENADWELVAAQVPRETDSEKLRELAAEFNRVLHSGLLISSTWLSRENSHR